MKGTITMISNLDNLVAAAKADPLCHFFDPDTMRFFNARNLDVMTLDGDNGYFVGSKRPFYGDRIYEVRRYSRDPETGHISFDSPENFDTAAKARAFARRLTA